VQKGENVAELLGVILVLQTSEADSKEIPDIEEDFLFLYCALLIPGLGPNEDVNPAEEDSGLADNEEEEALVRFLL